MTLLVHSLKNKNKYLMAKNDLLLKLSWLICKKATFLNLMGMHIRKSENEGSSFRK